MSTPPTAMVFADKLDPHEKLDWKLGCANMLEDGEMVATGAWTLEILPEGTALGLEIMTGSGRDPILMTGGQAIVFWLTINALFQDNAAFDGGGISLPMRLTFDSDALPSRKRQRTFLVPVAQQ